MADGCVLRALKRIARESNGKKRVVKVPQERRPTAESLERLETEISAQLDANRAMQYRSYIEADKK